MMKLIGLLLPLIIDTINTGLMIQSDRSRMWVSMIVASFFGIGLNFLEHNGVIGYTGLTMMEVAESLSVSILTMVGIAQVTYQVVWKQLSVRDVLGINQKENAKDQ